VAHTAGVTVFAVVMTDRHLGDPIAAQLGRAGADKVIACEGPGLAGSAEAGGISQLGNNLDRSDLAYP